MRDLYQSYYLRKNSRALFGFFIGSEYPLERYPRTAEKLPLNRPLAPEDFDVDAFAEDCEALHISHARAGGDMPYAASAFWGIPWIEALCGIPLYVGPKTIEARGKGTLKNIRFDENSGWARLCGQMLCRAAERSGGRYPLATTRTRGPADILSQLLGPEEAVYALMDEPELARGIMTDAARLIGDFWAFQYRHIPRFEGWVGSFYYHMLAPYGTCWHQEDASALLSPNLFEQFVLPVDRALVRRAGSVIMHQHPGPALPLGQNLAAGYAALELHLDEGGPSARTLMPEYRRILAEKPLLVWGRVSRDDLAALAEVPSEGLAVQVRADDPVQARELQAHWRALRAERP